MLFVSRGSVDVFILKSNIDKKYLKEKTIKGRMEQDREEKLD